MSDYSKSDKRRCFVIILAIKWTDIVRSRIINLIDSIAIDISKN